MHRCEFIKVNYLQQDEREREKCIIKIIKMEVEVEEGHINHSTFVSYLGDVD